MGTQGCLLFSKKIQKVWFDKWRSKFPENPFGNSGLPPEVHILFCHLEWNVRNFLAIKIKSYLSSQDRMTGKRNVIHGQ